jgi:hypothetical protein
LTDAGRLQDCFSEVWSSSREKGGEFYERKEEIVGPSKSGEGLVGESLHELANELAERREKCKIELQKRLNFEVEEVTWL